MPRLTNPNVGATSSFSPTLPPSQARPAPRMEKRAVEVTLPERVEHRGTSSRAMLYVALGLGSFSVGAWLALAEYIYG